MPNPDQRTLASTSVGAHLARGAIGFALIGSAVALTPSHGPVALLFAPLGMVALRGCPTCWIAGLIETISAGRLQRTCTETGCTLYSPTQTTQRLVGPPKLFLDRHASQAVGTTSASAPLGDRIRETRGHKQTRELGALHPGHEIP
jgi:hypothetical protein